jgi:hypothetical protein
MMVNIQADDDESTDIIYGLIIVFYNGYDGALDVTHTLRILLVVELFL